MAAYQTKNGSIYIDDEKRSPGDRLVDDDSMNIYHAARHADRVYEQFHGLSDEDILREFQAYSNHGRTEVSEKDLIDRLWPACTLRRKFKHRTLNTDRLDMVKRHRMTRFGKVTDTKFVYHMGYRRDAEGKWQPWSIESEWFDLHEGLFVDYAANRVQDPDDDSDGYNLIEKSLLLKIALSECIPFEPV